MLVVPSAKQFRFRTASWKYGRQNRVEHKNRVTQIFSFCVFTATQIALIAGLLPRLRCGAIARLKSGE